MKVYVASSWRNVYQQLIVDRLRSARFEVYDFRNPRPLDNGFHWSEIDPDWQEWTPEQYRAALQHPIAKAGFKSDFDAMKWADACLLVQPCGRSAHLELGWAVGAGKVTGQLILDKVEPELMPLMCDFIALSIDEAISELRARTKCGEAMYFLPHVFVPDPDGYCDLPKGHVGHHKTLTKTAQL